MAVYRPAAKCPKCGQPYEAINRPNDGTFIGDDFIRWDIENHVCAAVESPKEERPGACPSDELEREIEHNFEYLNEVIPDREICVFYKSVIKTMILDYTAPTSGYGKESVEQAADMFNASYQYCKHGNLPLYGKEAIAFEAGAQWQSRHTGDGEQHRILGLIEERIAELRELATDSGFHAVYDSKRQELEHLKKLIR